MNTDFINEDDILDEILTSKRNKQREKHILSKDDIKSFFFESEDNPFEITDEIPTLIFTENKNYINSFENNFFKYL